MSVYQRNGIYHFDFWYAGVRFRGSTETTSKRAAKEYERAEREKIKQAALTARDQRTAPMTVNVAFDRFWSEVGDTYSGTYRKTVWAALAWMTEEFGENTLLREIGPNRITEAVARRRAGGVRNSTVNRTVTELLRTIFRRARVKWEQKDLPEISWKDLVLAEPRERIRELRDHEEIKLIEAIPADYLPIVRFALVSGLRKLELVNLRWKDIDWTARTVSVLGKGGKPATIPLTSKMTAILSTLRSHHQTAVFTYMARKTRDGRRHGERHPITYSGLSSMWRRYGPRGAAGIEDFRFHDNRHTAATRLLRTSGNLKLVQKLLRHSDVGATVRYAHADDHDLRRAMESVESPHIESPHSVPTRDRHIEKKSGSSGA